MDRIWGAVRREGITMFAEGVADPENIDSLWREIFSGSRIKPCGVMAEQGLEEVVETEEQYIRGRHLQSKFTTDYPRISIFINAS